MEKKRDDRARNYACVIYPESAPENWKELLSAQLVPAFISPLHDSDIDPQNQPKKPHYHIMIMFEGKKSKEQAEELFTSIGGVGCEKVNSIRSYARYLCHLDNPDKAQYDPCSVTCFGGADYISIIGLASDKYAAIGEMMDFCDENNISSFYLLARYARTNRFDWFKMLCDNSSFYMREFLQSRSWSLSNGQTELVSPDGEILE